MATLVYLLCSLTSMACAYLLLRGYRRSGVALLLWSGLCFMGLGLNNVLFLIDVRYPEIPLLTWRKVPAVIGVSLLLYGLVGDSK